VIVKTAKAFIEDNYQRPITINEVAQKMAITPSHLMHLFKQKTGSTFGEYLMTFRMKKAIELLTNTELNIAEVANRVGYQDSNYFSRIFKNFHGMAPSEFKKNNCI
jgi:two-component system response regulator YesN